MCAAVFHTINKPLGPHLAAARWQLLHPTMTVKAHDGPIVCLEESIIRARKT